MTDLVTDTVEMKNRLVTHGCVSEPPVAQRLNRPIDQACPSGGLLSAEALPTAVQIASSARAPVTIVVLPKREQDLVSEGGTPVLGSGRTRTSPTSELLVQAKPLVSISLNPAPLLLTPALA